MDLKKSFGEDKDKAENGRWFELEEGGKVLVAKLNCPAFKAEVQRLQKPHLSLLQSTMDTSKLIDKITVIAMAKTILLGWENISLDGEEIEYSQEAAELLLKTFPDFREVISSLSHNRKNFMPEAIAEK